MLKILIADDNQPSRALLRALLGGIEAQILEASHGREALEIITREEPGLALLDIEMPFLDGYSILRAIRENPRLAAMKVFAVTANVMGRAQESAMAAGFDGYISKPIAAHTVRNQLRDLLNPRRELS